MAHTVGKNLSPGRSRIRCAPLAVSLAAEKPGLGVADGEIGTIQKLDGIAAGSLSHRSRMVNPGIAAIGALPDERWAGMRGVQDMVEVAWVNINVIAI